MKILRSNKQIEGEQNIVFTGKVKDLIYFGRVKDSIDEFDLIELKTLVKKTLNQNLREFLFGNSQTRSTSQGLVSKALCMELGTPHETQPNLFYQTKI